MPDKNYSVDDILNEIRRKQQSAEPAAETRKPAAPQAPAMSEEERRLLGRALEHGKGRSYNRREEDLLDTGTEYFPPVKLDLQKEEPAPMPSLDRLWEEKDSAPVRRERREKPAPAQSPAKGRQNTAKPARAMWDAEPEEEPQAPAQRPGPALWDEEPPAQTKRPARSAPLWDEEPQPARPAKPIPLWSEAAEPARPAKTARPAAPARGGTGRLDTTAAARLITGVKDGEESFEDRVVQKARGSKAPRPREEDEEPPRRPRRASQYQDDEEPPRGRRRREEPEEEASRRPRRPAREQEEARPRNPRIGSQLRGMKTSLIIRLAANLLCAAGVVYLALAPDKGLPIPGFFLENENLYLWLEVGLVAFSALVAGNTVGGGMISLFCLRPNNDSYSAIGVFACLVQGSYMAMRPDMMEGYAANLYLPMAALLLLFNTVGKLILRARVARSYRFIAQEGAKHTAAVIDSDGLARRLGAGLIDDEPEIAYFTHAAGVSSFLDQAFSESKAEDISKIIAPMTAVAALVMAVISYPFHHDVFTSACVFTAALCITAPIAGVISANLPITLVNRRLDRWGATLCGYSAVNQFADVNGVVLRCSDLFPPQSVTLHTIRPFNRTPMDEVILDAASVLSQCDSTLTQIFMEMVSGPEILREVESLDYEDGMGVSAWVGGRRVLIGNRELMKNHGVAIPPREYEEQYGQGKQILYLANSGQAAAMCVLTYKPDKQMRRSLELLADRDIAVCVYSTDPNVTEERVSQLYGFPRELVRVIPAALHGEVDRFLDPKLKTRAGVVHTGAPASYVRAVAAARSCDSILTVETALILLSVVVGFALVTFFAFTGGMSALTWITIAAYQAFWAVIQLLVALVKRS